MLQLHLDTQTGPKYARVAQAIETQIKTGVLKVGVRLPAVRDLAWHLKLTPGTVARAYRELTDKGLLQAEVGRGTFVAPPKTPIQIDVWAKEAEIFENPSAYVDPPDSHDVNLFSPRAPDLGQVALIQSALRQVAKLGGGHLLNYPVRAGYGPVRQAVADWLIDVPLGRFSPDDIVLSHGGQSAICLCLQAILQGPSPTVLVEDLSYPGFRRAAEVLRANVAGVPMDDQGLVPEALDAAIRATGAQVLCTSPEVQNPTTLYTPLQRRLDIVRVCARHGVQILEDDCYRIAEAKTDCYRRLAPDLGWFIGSISKALTPALRIGFGIAPRGRTADLRRVAEYGFFGVSQPLAELTRLLLSDPKIKPVAVRVRERLSDYVRVAVNVLGGHDLSWNAEVPFVWLRLPPGWRASAFCRAAEREGIQVRSADEFALRDGRAPHAVRIAVNAHVSLTSFEAALFRLLRLLNNPPEQISG